ncbi:MAG: Ig-like domain-containing protein [Ignavibacteriae bacterium]|nr:Ig-like domain-containing protein [Ignavibacteriota bacterium]
MRYVFSLFALSCFYVLVSSGQQVISVTPASNDIDVEQSANVLIVFNVGLNSFTLTNNSIRVIGSQSGIHNSASISFDSISNRLTFDPDIDFKNGEEITVSLTNGIQDKNGNSIVPYSWRFLVKTNHGNSSFVNTQNLTAGSFTRSIVAADFDGNGSNDFCCCKWNIE